MCGGYWTWISSVATPSTRVHGDGYYPMRGMTLSDNYFPSLNKGDDIYLKGCV